MGQRRQGPHAGTAKLSCIQRIPPPHWSLRLERPSPTLLDAHIDFDTRHTSTPIRKCAKVCTKAIQVVRIPVCSHKSSLSKQLASRGDDCSRRASKRGGVVVEARARGVSGGRRLGGPHCIYSQRPLPTSGPLPASSSPLPLSA